MASVLVGDCEASIFSGHVPWEASMALMLAVHWEASIFSVQWMLVSMASVLVVGWEGSIFSLQDICWEVSMVSVEVVCWNASIFSIARVLGGIYGVSTRSRLGGV
jgi:hypothetical protein